MRRGRSRGRVRSRLGSRRAPHWRRKRRIKLLAAAALPLFAALALLARASFPDPRSARPETRSAARNTAPTRPAPRNSDPSFGTYWHDGKAELDGYRYRVVRYGQLRTGRCVAVYVTEPMSRSRRVKVEDPTRNPRDVDDVLKLNLVRDFQTGIYDYDTMTSLFVRTRDFEPLKVSFSSTEWCGNVYEELRVDPARLHQTLASYFEGESATRDLARPRGGLLEEELFIRLRGLSGDFLKPGERTTVPFMHSAFRRRLTHRPLRWTQAAIERAAGERVVGVPAGRFACIVYSVHAAEIGEGFFWIERAYPHRIVRWEWKGVRGGAVGGPPLGESSDSGELAGTERTAYWRLHAEGDETALKKLGVWAPSRPR